MSLVAKKAGSSGLSSSIACEFSRFLTRISALRAVNRQCHSELGGVALRRASSTSTAAPCTSPRFSFNQAFWYVSRNQAERVGPHPNPQIANARHKRNPTARFVRSSQLELLEGWRRRESQASGRAW